MSRVSALSTQASSKVKPLHIHLFRQQDLRLHDNPALCKTIDAAKRSADATGILPIFCFDPRIFGNDALSEFGSIKCGPRRAKFVLESVADLRSNLEKQGSGLVVAHGKPEDVIQTLLNKIDPGTSKEFFPKVCCQQEVASEEIRVEKAVRSVVKSHNPLLGSLEAVWGSTMYDPEDLPFRDGVYGIPDTFTPFRNKVEKNCEIGNPLPSPSDTEIKLCSDWQVVDATDGSIPKCSLKYFPTLEELGYSAEQVKVANTHDPRGVMEFKGGETAALARVKDYIWDKDRLKIYFDTRNGMLGPDYSTKFSPWLAHGCLSPRYVARECRRYEGARVANKSTYWVVFELLWRDFWKFFAHKHGNNIFFLDGTLGRDAIMSGHANARRWGLDKRTLAAWKEGRTGFPLVDANMRELAATGFQSNRGRQNVCSFLALDTNTDWRYGADYFETELLDYDIYSNWGNWCAGAGMTGGRLNRFNIVKQSKDYDCDGDYVRHWIPELKDVPTQFVHEPWKLSKEQQAEFGCRLGVDYPNPIIEPFVPKQRGGGGRGGERSSRGGHKGGKKGGRGEKNPNRSKGQRQDMKSLKQGSYNFK